MSELLAPNGKPSNLTAEQYKLVRTPAFKEWFGDWENEPENSSKVINEETKEPLVVYHRTNSDFNEFNNNKATYKKGFIGGNLYYFSDDRYNYSDYGNREVECFIDLKNPTYKVNFNGEYLPKSNDGAILKYDRFGFKENVIIATKNNQIKLADGTNTTFDGSNPDIRFNNGGSVLLAPNGEPSNLTPEQYKLVRTPAFKEWFGDWENDPANSSKVIDIGTKEPLVVYHGTDNEFNEFRNFKDIHFFTQSENEAYWFVNEHKIIKDKKDIVIKKCFLNIRKIFNGYNVSDLEKQKITNIINNIDDLDDLYLGGDYLYYKKEFGKEKLSDIDYILFLLKSSSNYMVLEQDVFINWFMKEKYNGFIVTEYGFKKKNYAVFNSNQIKLADGTNTTFDGSNPDIRFNDGGEVNTGLFSQIWEWFGIKF